MTTPSFKVPNPLDHAVSAQVQHPIESAITIGGTVYPNFDLHKTTVLDVKHEFATVIATIDHLVLAYNSMPADSDNQAGLENHIIDADLGSKGGAVAAALQRTAGSIKSLSEPVSHEEGLALIKCYKELHDRVDLLYGSCNVRVRGLEQGAPGLMDYCFERLMTLVTPVTEALSAVLPADEVQLIHSNMLSFQENAFTHLRAAKSKSDSN